MDAMVVSMLAVLCCGFSNEAWHVAVMVVCVFVWWRLRDCCELTDGLWNGDHILS